MLRAFRFALLAIILLALAWYVANLTGQVTVEIGSYAATASTPVAIVLFLLLLGLLILALSLLRGLLGLPRRIANRRTLARRDAADAASLRALSALAAGDRQAAAGHARIARRNAPDAPLTLYVSAEAARLTGDEAAARTHFTALSRHQDAGFLGWRGLIADRDATSGDQLTLAETDAQAKLAAVAYPNSSWLREQRMRLAVGQGNFAEAARLATEKPVRAALAIMASRGAESGRLAIDWAREAVRDAPNLPEAWLVLYQARRRAGQTWRARRALERGWKAAPHPDLGNAWLSDVQQPLERASQARKLANLNPLHPESAALLARTARAADLTGEAERQQKLFGSRAAWICGACDTDHDTWQVTCRKCGAIGTLSWIRSQPDESGITTPLLPAPHPAT